MFVRLKLSLDIGRWFPEKSGELNSEFFISMNCSKNVAKDPKNSLSKDGRTTNQYVFEDVPEKDIRY